MILPIILISIFCWLMIVLIDGRRISKFSLQISYLFVVIVGIILVLITTFRSGEMADYSNYSRIFNNDMEGRIEFGFISLIFFVKSFLSREFVFFLGVVGAISIFMKVFAITKLSNYIWGSMAIYISSRFILLDMIQIRAAISVGFFLLSLYFVFRGNLKKYIVSTTFSILFHWSALITIPCWFMNTKRIEKKFYLPLIPLSYLFALMGYSISSLIGHIPIPAVQNLYEVYTISEILGGSSFFNIFDILYLGRSFICILLILGSDQIGRKNPTFILFLKLYTIAICSYCLLWSFPVAAYRVSEYLLISEIFVIPCFVSLFPKNQIVGKGIVIFICSCYLYSNIVLTKLVI